jgi:hypothetical protein
MATAAWREAKLISFFLPINDFKEMFAANAVLEAITKQFGGYTRSSMEKGADRPMSRCLEQAGELCRY